MAVVALLLSASAAIPVSTGFTWTTAAVGLLNLLVGGVLVQLIRQRAPLKKLNNEREANLLLERAAEMELMRKRINVLEAQRSVDRHEINNLNQCLDALIMLIELNPERAKEGVARVKEMRAEQNAAIALEKAAMQAAKVADEGETK